MNENDFSMKEMMSHRFDELTKNLDEVKADGKEQLSQIKIQNGRMTKMENWSTDAQKVIENTTKIATDTLASYKTDKRVMWVAYVLLVFFLGTITSLAIMAINSKIKDGIAEALLDYKI